MRSIDESGKIERVLDNNVHTFLKHDLFKSWVADKLSIFA